MTTPAIEILGTQAALFRFSASTGCPIEVAPPRAEVDGEEITLTGDLALTGSRAVTETITEHRYEGPVSTRDDLTLTLLARIAANSPVLRFKYHLSSASSVSRLTKRDGSDNFSLATIAIGEGSATEVRLSDYNSLTHSFVPAEADLHDYDFTAGRSVMGPILTWAVPDGHALLAYEHGSQYPDTYLAFALGASSAGRSIDLRSVKGTYLDRTPLSAGYETVWLQLVSVDGPRANLEHTYRSFLLHSLAVHPHSRKPSVYYNTWSYQERVQYWKGQSPLTEMNEQRMLEEIDAAHSMGIEVFVLDCGWYGSPGDWPVSSERFPRGLGPIKAKLDGYGMEMGLWFGPTTAALSSAMHARHLPDRMTWHGELLPTRVVWETEESAEICLSTSYGDDFADELIRCAREFGFTYFKWDAVEQYGCDSPDHRHGDASHSREERADSYAYQQPLVMTRIVEKIADAVPGTIVDFDITESHRSVGLSFLSAGKYFLINNGPYFRNLDIPKDKDVSYVNNNVFTFPGSARDWICRTPLTYDTWVPSVLFLVHYLPDDPSSNQDTTVGSLILGHGGIWGDLVGISESGRERIRRLLAPFKQIRDASTSVALVRTGDVGTVTETYEKIDAASGAGLTVMFANQRMQGIYGDAEPVDVTYITAAVPSTSIWHTPNVEVDFDDDGHAVISAEFTDVGAAIVYFGVEHEEAAISPA